MVNIVRCDLCMVKKGSKRFMITCTPKTIQYSEVLQDYYDMTFSELIKLLVAKEIKERNLG